MLRRKSCGNVRASVKNLLITGGLGYVGGRIANYFADRHPSTRIHLATSNKQRMLPNWAEGLVIAEMDLEDPASIARCLRAVRFDAIVHLAALNEHDSLADPLRAYRINTVGTYHLAREAKLTGVSDMIYFSTFHVYGETRPGEIITESTATFPTHPYAATHRAAEDIMAYFRTYEGLRTAVFRLSNGFGYPMDIQVNRWTLVVNDLCRQAVTQGKIVLKTSGRQHRDFIALADVARAVEIMLCDKRGEWGDGLYNLGGESSVSILDVAHRVADCCERRFGSRPELFTGADSGGQEHPIHFSIEKFKTLGFKPQADMDSEILGTLSLCAASMN